MKNYLFPLLIKNIKSNENNLNNSSIDVVIVIINKNIPINYQIPGVAYLNYPEIATEITSIRVKIELIKDKSINVTPSVYSYKLIAKVKKL